MQRAIITQDIIDSILRLHKEGKSCTVIAKELGIGKTSVTKYIRIYDEDSNISTDKFTQELIDKLTKEYKNGKSIKQLSKENNLSASSLSAYIYRNVRNIDNNINKDNNNNVFEPIEVKSEFSDKVSVDKDKKIEKQLDIKEVNNKEKNLSSEIDKNDISKQDTDKVDIVSNSIKEEKLIDRMVALYRTGHSLTEISKEVGMSRSAVTRRVYKRLGITSNKRFVVQKKVDTPEPIDSVVIATKKWTLEDKIDYCNKKYGEGKWRFLTKKEVLDLLKTDGIIS